MLERVQVGQGCSREGCRNFARVGEDTCRWHRPEVTEIRATLEETRQQLKRAVGA